MGICLSGGMRRCCVCEKRVAPFPNLPRKDNNGENKATELCCNSNSRAKLYSNREVCAGRLVLCATKNVKIFADCENSRK